MRKDLPRLNRRRFAMGAAALTVTGLAGGIAAPRPGLALQASTPETATGAPKRGGRLVGGRIDDSDNLDVAFAGRGIDAAVTRYVHDTLVEPNRNGGYDPILAESFAISPDAKTYTFKLRQGITFHDGTDFNADAVKSTFEYMLHPGTAQPQNAGLLEGIQSIDVLGPYQIQLVFGTVFAPMMANLAEQGCAISSPAARAKFGADYRSHPVGTGPFVFQEWVPQDHITLARNEHYHGFRSYLTNAGPPYIDGYDLRVIPDMQTILASLEAGEINYVEELAASQVAPYQGNPAYTLLEDKEGTNLTYLEFMFDRDNGALHYKKPFDDIRLRQAVGYALNVQDMMDAAMFGLAVRNKTPMPVGLPGYDPTIGDQYGFDYDPARAKQLIAAAGGPPSEIVLWTTSGDQRGSAFGQLAQSQLQAVGFKVKYETVENSVRIADIRSEHPTPHLMLNDNGKPELDFLYYQTDWVEGIGHYQEYNPAFKALVDKTRQTVDLKERIKYAHDAQVLMMQDASHFPLWTEIRTGIIRAEVKDFVLGPYGLHVFNDIYIASA
jgi:peptide/nickel transport system substrate-binding protein